MPLLFKFCDGKAPSFVLLRENQLLYSVHMDFILLFLELLEVDAEVVACENTTGI